MLSKTNGGRKQHAKQCGQRFPAIVQKRHRLAREFLLCLGPVLHTE